MDMQAVSQEIVRSFNYLRPRKKWSFSRVNRQETHLFTHGYHRYPAKFIPHIVKELINLFAPSGKETICDPFGGCGTTLVEAKLQGRKSIGFDINPVAKLITQVKVTPINPKVLEKYRDEFITRYRDIKGRNFRHHPRIKYWFDEETLKTLDRIYFVIKKIKNPKVKRFFLCAFSHNLKNSSRWLMKSIKPTVDKNKKIQNPEKTFLFHLDSMIKKNKDFYDRLQDTERLAVPALMYRKDSTKTLPLKSGSIDLIITSPPYITSYEYADLHQLSLLWFGDDKSAFKSWNNFSDKLDDFKKKFVGTSHKIDKTGPLYSVIAEKSVRELAKKDRALSADATNYYLDMRKAFKEMYRILKPGGKACIIIGNTSLYGVEMQNAQIAVEQMFGLGFYKVDFIKREIINKMITPWRDKETGKFTSVSNPNKKRVYDYEYIIIMEK